MGSEIGNLLPLDQIARARGRALLLVRHGQTEANREHRFNGRGDTVLNEAGHRQAAALASFLQNLPLAAIWSSPLQRARQTAAPLLAHRPLFLQVDERLSELDQGELEGLQPHVLMERYTDFFAAWRQDPSNARVPGGETMREAQHRMLCVLEDIAGQTPAGGPPVVVVSHNMAISAALCGLAGAPLSQFRAMSPKNTAVTLLESRGGVLQVVAQNIRAHLQTG